MPPVSKAQARFMFANRGKKSKIGKVAREFTEDLAPGSIKKLPARKKRKK